MECKYCLKEITGQRRKFCCHNHKTSYYKREVMKKVQTLKELIPEMFEEGYEWNENDANMLKLYFQHKDIIQDYINLILEEKTNNVK